MESIIKALSVIGIIMAIAIAPGTGFSQSTYEFGYDAAGNRVSRAVILLKSAAIGKGASATADESPLVERVGNHTARIYPNPTKGVLSIELAPVDTRQAIVSVYDITGKLLRRRKPVSGSCEVDLSPFPAGTYILMIATGQEGREWKIVKE